MDIYEPKVPYGIQNDTLTKEDLIADLKENYTKAGHPIASGGIQTVYNYYQGHLTTNDIIQALSEIEGYSLHKEFHKQRRNPSYAHFPRYRFELDLIDVQNLAADNDGINYLLNCIDCFTRYAFMRPLPSKHGAVVLEAFKSILQEAGSKPLFVLFDRGCEFYNKLFQDYCTANGIKVLSADTSGHAPMVERLNLSLQRIMYQYLSENETNRYIDKQNPDGTTTQLIPLFLKTYNNRRHRMIGVTPYQAETQPELHMDIQKRLNKYHSTIKQQKPRFQIGDSVRIAKMPGKFNRGYEQQASLEIFKIHSIKTKLPIPLYILSNYRGDEILKGGFYGFELVKVSGDVFRVEKVLRRRRYRGRNQLFVKWKGFDDSYNSWIDAGDVVQTFQS